MRALVVGLIAFSTLCFADDPEIAAPRLDPTFGVRGVAELRRPMPGRYFVVYPDLVATAADSGGRTFSLFRGYPWKPGASRIVATTPTGALDETFGTRGVLDVSPRGWFTSLHVDSRDRIVLVGRAPAPGTGYAAKARIPALLRLWPDGSVDENFGTDGVVRIGHESEDGVDFWGSFLAPIPGGSDAFLVATPRIARTDGSPPAHGTVRRVDSDGRIDPRYSGALPADVSSGPFEADSAGRLVFCHGDKDLSITRLDASGDVDVAFGTEGTTTLRPGVGPVTPIGLTIDRAGRSVVLLGGAVGIARLTPDGAPDASWGANGDGLASLPWSDVSAVGGLVEARGRYVVAVAGTDPSDGDPAISLGVVSPERFDEGALLALPRRAWHAYFDPPALSARGRSVFVGTLAFLGRSSRRRPNPVVTKVLIDGR